MFSKSFSLLSTDSGKNGKEEWPLLYFSLHV